MVVITMHGGPVDGRTYEVELIGRDLRVPLFEGRRFLGVGEDGQALWSYPEAVYDRDGFYVGTVPA